MKKKPSSRGRSSAQPSAEGSVSLYRHLQEGLLIVFVAIAGFMLLALSTYHPADPGWSHYASNQVAANAAGRVGAWLADVSFCVFGYLAYIFPVALVYLSWLFFYQGRRLLPRDSTHLLTIRIVGFLLVMISGCALANLYWHQGHVPFHAGGLLGYLTALHLVMLFNTIGSSIMLCALWLAGMSLLLGCSWIKIMEVIGRYALEWMGRLVDGIRDSAIPNVVDQIKTMKKSESKPKLQVARVAPEVSEQKAPKVNLIKHVLPGVQSAPAPVAPQKTAPKMKRFPQPKAGALPQIELLNPPSMELASVGRRELEERSKEVEARLADFGVAVRVVAVYPGPVVTRFELELAAGTKVSKITGLAKDLARSLSVVSVRVVEVIPGKSVIGIELPNETRELVSLSDVLSSKVYKQSQSALTLALGKDIAGHPVVVDLAKMPHLLVAGTTGSGKSVGLNGMLLSLLYKSTPKQLRLILIDPKMLELAIYDDIPHLLVPVVTDMKDAASALRWCVVEMERRYRLMAAFGVRNIAGYNAKVKEAADSGKPLLDPLQPSEDGEATVELEELPKIVVLADEFADMMVVVGKKVETLIARLAQKARAAGIHLIFATQRPSVDVITGLIKANIPSRIAFQVSSKVDSRTILDQQGADQLLGHGDMLYLAPGSGVPMRVHGAFVADEEVHRVVDYLKQTASPMYLEDILDESAPSNGDATGYLDAAMGESGSGDAEQDALYDQAVDAVARSRRVSISSIQRRFKIGYNRAARIVEAMEAAGVVSSGENGPREVLVPPVHD